MKKNRRAALLAVCSIIACTLGCAQPQQQTSDNRAADEAAIRDADTAWSSAAGTKQVDAFVSYYSDDAVVLPANTPMVTGKDAIRKWAGGMLASPGFSLKWQSAKVEVAHSGDIGYSRGTFELTMTDPKGAPIMDHGKYIEVWKKQTDGAWKVAVDTFNSDVAAAQ